ncbi:MAG: hypothetical protein PHT94_01575 [Candidatus Nanoarchaeia archaeon]|nr:hypothetical protein [Candidatus Nanoarchaeia archaeon]
MSSAIGVSADGTLNLVLVIILATLIAIVWAMRYLVVMQRSMTRIEKHIEKLILRTIKEEEEILKEVESEKKELKELEKKI